MVSRQTEDAIQRHVEDSKRTRNTFNSLETSELVTQWKHKISVIPETEGITIRWWDFTSGVSRTGPEAEIPAGETIQTKQSGEYIVGKPALGGNAVRMTGNAQSGAGDDYWAGYTDRVDKADADDNGAGIGHAYFNQGDGDEGGALEDGDQEYVWFKSGVSGVSDLRVPRDQWNGEDISDVAPSKGEILQEGGFLRVKFTFYNQGSVEIRWGFKKNNGETEVRTIHRFSELGNPMWTQSDLKMAAGTLGTNLTGYTNAAHFKVGDSARLIRENGAGRDGTVFGSSVSVTQGDPVPLISIQLRDGWENVNIEPVGLNVDMNDSFYVFISVGADLTGDTFEAPNSGNAEINPTGSEYAALVDNDASDFNSIGEIEFFSFVSGGGQGQQTGANISETIPDFSLADGEIATVGIIPVDATTFNGGSFRWGANF